MNNILYTRVSTGEQGSQSLGAQNQICLKYLNSNGLTLNAHYSEIGSAFNGNQKVLNNLINNHVNSILYVLNVTRFSRNVEKGLNMLRIASNNNIRVIFIEEQLDSMNKSHSHQIRVKLSESQQESEVISNRINNVNQILSSQGWRFGVPEYGKKSIMNGDIRKFVNNDVENNIADFICQARDGISCKILNKKLKKIIPNAPSIYFYDTDGVSKIQYFNRARTLSFQEIADLLNDYNIKKRGKEWSASMVSSVYNCFSELNGKFNKMELTI